jgi:subtilisin family serine protease
MAGAVALSLCAGVSAPSVAWADDLVDITMTEQAVINGERSSGHAKVLAKSAEVHEYALYTVVLREPSIASYSGGISVYAAPPRIASGDRAGRINLDAPETRAYASFLEQRQQQVIGAASNLLRRPLQPEMTLSHAINGFIAEMTSDEAAKLAQMDGVELVERERFYELAMDRGPMFIGSGNVWNGAGTPNGISTRGEGIVVGILDTGINWQSPMFAAISPGDGYVHQNPLGAGNYLGLCGATAPNADLGRCNAKVIGMYNFTSTATNRTGTDDNGHGSHVAGTTAGNPWLAPFGGGTFEISGVAPRANIISYKVCAPSCPSTAIVAATDAVIASGIVDVVNFSISGGSSPWNEANSLGFLSATNAGILWVAAAGNSGPGPATADHQEPWVQTVAAGTHDRGEIAFEFKLTGGTAATQSLAAKPGAPPIQSVDLVNVPLIKSPTFDNGATDGCSAYPADTFRRAGVPGVAVLHLDAATSACGSVTRRTNAANAGATGVIFVDVGFINLGATGNSWAMRRSDWDLVENEWTPATAQVSILTPLRGFSSTATPDHLAAFSGRGPRALAGGQFLGKPDILAPGVAILSADWFNPSGGSADAVRLNNGTSMASPHVAGAAALLRSLHPTWTPMQIKSALKMTAKTADVFTHTGTPAMPWDRGSGRVQVDVASRAGLLLDETGANFTAANPAIGGNLATLNLASMASGRCVGTCTFTRTVRRGQSGLATYNLSLTGLPAGATVSPSSITLGASGTRSFQVSIDGTQLDPLVWTHGELVLTHAGGTEPTLHMPISVLSPGPVIAATPASLDVISDVATSRTVTVQNTGNPSLDWSVATGSQPVGLLNQVPQIGSGFRGSEHVSTPANTFFAADDFHLPAAGSVSFLQSNGFILPSTASLTTATKLTFEVYADNNGAPAGAPNGRGAAPLFTHSTTPAGAGVNVATGGVAGNISLNLTTAGITPPALPAGRYWVVVYPTLPGTGANNASNPLWAAAVTGWGPALSGNPPMSVGATGTAWAPAVSGTSGPAEAFSMVVNGNVTCGAPWIQTTNSSGSLGVAGSADITVNLDPTGLSPGVHTAALCLSSNATNAPVIFVPVRLAVPSEDPNPTVSMAFAPTTVSGFVPSRLTVTLGNPGGTVSTLTSALTHTLPSGLLVSPTPNAVTTCASGTVTAAAGSSAIVLASGAQIPAVGSCTVAVNVRTGTEGTYENVLPAGALQTTLGQNAAAATATLTVTAPVFPAPYCTATFPSGVEPITLVQFGAIDNASSAAVGGSPLENFTAISTGVDAGGNYTITVKGNSGGDFPNVYRVYFDWNQDGFFDEAATERYEIGTIINSTGLDEKFASTSITVPVTAQAGSTRMRVVKRFNVSGTACNAASFGQAEDYTVIVAPRPDSIFADGFEAE